MKRRIIVGISGASGVVYGVRVLQQLRALGGIETHLIVSEGGARTLAVETDWRAEDLRGLCDVWHRNDNLAASIASGSFVTHGMIVAPCSIRTLSASNGPTGNGWAPISIGMTAAQAPTAQMKAASTWMIQGRR